MKKNEIVRIEITDITSEGYGVGRADGYVLFVPQTCPGDIIDAHVLKAGTSYGYAKVEKLISASEDRVLPDCGAFSRCGGCVFRHISYEKELEIKKKSVYDSFKRIGGFDIECERIQGSPSVSGYRNKAQYPACVIDGKMRFGFYSRQSHRVVPYEECPLQPDFYGEIAKETAAFCDEYRLTSYDENTGKGLLRHLYIRDGRASGEVMVCLVSTSDIPHGDVLVKRLTEKFKKIKTVVVNINKKDTNVILSDEFHVLYGKGYITDTLCGCIFDISPRSFYQVNHDGAEILYSLAAEYAEPEGKTVFDLYCGTGTIGLTMAKRAKKLIGVEIIPEAVENAVANAEKNGVKNAEFICADAGEAAEKLASEGCMPDVIIVDPPRSGCGAEVISAICKMSPGRIVMVSCNSPTAARDCASLRDKGYEIKSLTSVDMFPRTGHVETVVLMSRVEE